MSDKYCDCGDPFQIHESNDPNCSKVRGDSPNGPSSPTMEFVDQRAGLLTFARKVSSLAQSLSAIMTVLGILTIVGGIIIAFQGSSIDLGNGYVVASHPYISLGIMISFAGLLQILVFRLIFNYIEMQAKYREWQLSK